MLKNKNFIMDNIDDIITKTDNMVINNSTSLVKYTDLWNNICMSLTQETAKILNTKQTELKNIQWSVGEANTDSEFSKLACKCCVEAFNIIKIEKTELNNLSLECNIPDINIKFIKNSKIIARGKIELKSGKHQIIPGSTIGKFDINTPVIFCFKNEIQKKFEFRYGQYFNCIGESDTDTFQDRTPRPKINFLKMTDINVSNEYIHREKSNWTEHYANCAVRRINNNINKSWQDSMINDIKKLFIQEFIKKTSVDEFTIIKTTK